MNLKLEKARLEASMEVLKHKKEAAAAIAEAAVLEAAADAGGSCSNESHSCDLNTGPVPLVASRRTEQNVMDQLREKESELQLSGNGETALRSPPPPPDLQADTKPFVPRQNKPAPPNLSSQEPCRDVDGGAHDPATRYCREACAPHVRIKDDYVVPVQQFTPGHYDGHPSHYPMPPNCNNGSSHLNDFVRYLARRELVATGLLQFNDKPQTYRAWRRSFQTATSGLKLTPSEELDLLLKWLGKESAEQVEQIRAIHIHRPEAGLAMAWDRLDQTYGSAEAIENALFKRVDSFPKITGRDGFKLTKLSDLLMELQSAKVEGDLPSLSFLDTSRGVNPIVQKLPPRLQEKWISAGASYKRQNQVP